MPDLRCQRLDGPSEARVCAVWREGWLHGWRALLPTRPYRSRGRAGLASLSHCRQASETGERDSAAGQRQTKRVVITRTSLERRASAFCSDFPRAASSDGKGRHPTRCKVERSCRQEGRIVAVASAVTVAASGNFSRDAAALRPAEASPRLAREAMRRRRHHSRRSQRLRPASRPCAAWQVAGSIDHGACTSWGTLDGVGRGRG